MPTTPFGVQSLITSRSGSLDKELGFSLGTRYTLTVCFWCKKCRRLWTGYTIGTFSAIFVFRLADAKYLRCGRIVGRP